MKPAIINADKKTISCKPAALNASHAWTSISTVNLCSMPTLFDEIGIICQIGDQQLYVRETEDGFTAVIDFLKSKCEFPEDWYQQVEQGEELVLAPQAT